MERTDATDRVCSDCWKRAIYAHGTGELFLKRSLKYTKLLRALSFFGIVVPLLIGGVVLGFGTHGACLEPLIGIAAFAGVVQLAFSAWSLVYSWADNLEYSLESSAENFDLSLKFRELGAQAESPPDDLMLRVTELKAKDEARQRADTKKGVSEKEMRYAHRAGLRQFGRACDDCGKIPYSMEPTTCPVCGRF